MSEHPLQPGATMHLDALSLEHHAIDDGLVVSGSPTSATLALARVAGTEVAVWEISEGVSTDVEIDELFIVLSGRATVEITGVETPLELREGTVGRLAAGMQTRWTVTEALRKVYIAAADS